MNNIALYNLLFEVEAIFQGNMQITIKEVQYQKIHTMKCILKIM
jgi:hypothetical protein